MAECATFWNPLDNRSIFAPADYGIKVENGIRLTKMGKRKRKIPVYLESGALRNRKHEIFALELATGAPLEESYLVAGFKPGYSAKFNASRLRNHPDVKERIEELLTEFQRQSFLKMEWVLRELTRIVEVKDPSKLTIKGDGERIAEYDRHGALRSIGQFLGGDASRPELDPTKAKWRRMSPEEAKFKLNFILAHEREQAEQSERAAIETRQIEAKSSPTVVVDRDELLRRRIAAARSKDELAAIRREIEAHP